MSIYANVAAAALGAALFSTNVSAHTRLAPADEYFGRMKMSVLEIGNRLHDLTRRCDANPVMQAGSIAHDSGLIEDAIRDWQRKYPADPWIPKDMTSLERIHVKLHKTK